MRAKAGLKLGPPSWQKCGVDTDDLGWNDGVKIKFRAPRFNGTLVIEAIDHAWSYHYRCQACGADSR